MGRPNKPLLESISNFLIIDYLKDLSEMSIRKLSSKVFGREVKAK